MVPPMTLAEYLEKQGHGASKRLADAIKATPTEVSDWSLNKRPIPAHRCVAIEIATAKAVTRKEMLPNHWHIFWPELAEAAN